MGDIVSFKGYKNKLPSCINCLSTNKEDTLGFYVCLNPLSPYRNELVSDKNLCEEYKRRMDD